MRQFGEPRKPYERAAVPEARTRAGLRRDVPGMPAGKKLPPADNINLGWKEADTRPIVSAMATCSGVV